MKLIENILTEIFGEVIKKSFNSETVKNFYIQETSNPNFGDFQTNFAMINAKELKMPPRKIAEKILENFPENSDVIEKTEIAGPGFINIFLKQEFLNNYLKKLLREKPDYSLTGPNDIVIDYSSPNIAKPMHIGHFRTTVIGDSIKRIFRYMGYNVIGDNHLGDWGTQFGKLIVAYRLWLDRENYEKNPINELEKLYVKFTLESEKDESLEEQARKELKKLQDGDAENTRLWKEFIEMSMKEYNKIYERLEISFDTYYGESFYHNIMPEIIKSLKEKNIAQQDQGALVVKFDEKEDLHPCIV
ncbi:MAG TPA: arginine--tRNA ligase, partial [Tepiditoga sp.]|nr:arginine--tRNA ligase [Tepiditoga sp.]